MATGRESLIFFVLFIGVCNEERATNQRVQDLFFLREIGYLAIPCFLLTAACFSLTRNIINQNINIRYYKNIEHVD